jgi:transcriptional regulator with XRE-family HTH domain
MDAKSIGRYIKLRRKDFNISQYTLAALSSISVNTLVAIERGEGNPRLENILSVLDTLGLQLTVTVKSDNTPTYEEM